MTREDIFKLLNKHQDNDTLDIKTAKEMVNIIFDEHEALQQPKSCAKCKAFKLDDEHNDGFGQCFWGIYFTNVDSSSYHKGTDFYCSEFEAYYKYLTENGKEIEC